MTTLREVPCENAGGFPARLIVFAHGDRIVMMPPRTQSLSLTLANLETLWDALRKAAVDATNHA